MSARSQGPTWLEFVTAGLSAPVSSCLQQGKDAGLATLAAVHGKCSSDDCEPDGRRSARPSFLAAWRLSTPGFYDDVILFVFVFFGGVWPSPSRRREKNRSESHNGEERETEEARRAVAAGLASRSCRPIA